MHVATVKISPIQADELKSLDARTAFWDLVPVRYEVSLPDRERRLRTDFPRSLTEYLQDELRRLNLGRRDERLSEQDERLLRKIDRVRVRVEGIWYGSLNIELGIPDIDSVLDLIGNNSEFLEAVLQDYVPRAFSALDLVADAGKSKQTARVALVIMRELFAEAVDNGNISENPTRKATLPNCKEATETKSLTVEQVCRLFERISGRDYLMWRVLILCGLRIGECIALKKTDVLPEGLLIDESALQGKAAQTKSRKRRLVPLPPVLRSELEDWARKIEGDLLFPGRNGAMLNRKGEEVTPMLSRAGKAAGIPDLTFRQCRTTFATLYRGDPRDLQAALGHSDLKLTMNIHRKPIVERQQAAMNELEARLTGKVVPIKKAHGA